MAGTGTFYSLKLKCKLMIKNVFVAAVVLSLLPSVQAADDQLTIKQLLNKMKAKQQVLQTQAAPAVSAPPAVLSNPQAVASESQIIDKPETNIALSNTVNRVKTNIPVYEDAVLASRFAIGEELILSLSVNGLSLSDIFVVKSSRSFQLGLGDFFQLIEYPIYVDLETKSATGWFLNEKNAFLLTLNADGALKVQVGDKQYSVAAQHYEFLSDDLFIEIEEIARWFNFAIDFSEAELAVNIISTQKFPMEARLARRASSVSAAGGTSRSVMPVKASPYQIYSSPMLDIQTSVRQTEQETLSNYSVLGNLDLAYFNTEFFLSGNNFDLLNDARLTLSRQSTQSDLLGVLKATEVAVGDVTPVTVGFSRTQQQSRGIYVTNTPLNQLADNRRVNLTGEVQNGWDVELYRNGVLLDRRFAINDGRYEFNDVDLAFGQNDFELVFYGPQGQIETKTESYIVDSNNVKTGQSSYRFSVVDVNKSLFGLNDAITDASGYGVLFGGVYDYGLTDWLSVGAGTSLFMPDQGEDQQYYTLNANLSLGKVGLLNTTLTFDTEDRTTLNSSFRTRIWETNWNFSHSRDQYLLTDNVFEQQKTTTTSVIMDGKIEFEAIPLISYQNSWQRTNFSNGEYTETLENALGINSAYGSFTHNLLWNKNAITDFSGWGSNDSTDEDPAMKSALLYSDSLSGSLQYRKSFGAAFTRLFSSYAIKPDTELLSYGAAVNYPWTPELSSEMRFSYFVPDDQYQLNLGLNWRKDAFHLNTNFNYNERGDWVLGLSARFSVGYTTMSNDVFTSGRSISQYGGAAVRVFEDLNMNGVYDADEPLLKNVKVKAVQSYRQGLTNEDGVAILTSLYNNVTTDIVVEETSIDGPFMITAIPGVAITARKGYLEQLEFPVVKAGELEGTIYQQADDGENMPAPYIMLNLVNEQGDIVASTRSEYDGLYLFSDVKPGKYQLKVDDAYIDRKGLKKVKDKQVQFSSQGDLIVGIDFTLAPLENAEGYVVSAGQFNSAGMLKVYYQMLKQRLNAMTLPKPFYIRSRNNNKFVLGLAYFEKSESSDEQAMQQANQICQQLSRDNISCQVEYHGFQY